MKREILLCIGLVAVTAILAAIINRHTRVYSQQIVFSENMTLKKVAKKNGVLMKRILHIMSHEDRTVWKLPKDQPIHSLRVDSQAVRSALEHIKEESNPAYATLH